MEQQKQNFLAGVVTAMQVVYSTVVIAMAKGGGAMGALPCLGWTYGGRDGP